MTTTHTPTPWKHVNRPQAGRGPMKFKRIVVDADGSDVAEVYGETQQEACDVAERICAAVNPLVSAWDGVPSAAQRDPQELAP